MTIGGIQRAANTAWEARMLHRQEREQRMRRHRIILRIDGLLGELEQMHLNREKLMPDGRLRNQIRQLLESLDYPLHALKKRITSYMDALFFVQGGLMEENRQIEINDDEDYQEELLCLSLSA